MDGLGMAGLIVAVIAIFVAIAVGVYQVAATRDRPRVRFRSLSVADARASAKVDNAGGATTLCIALARADSDFFKLRGSLEANTKNQPMDFVRLGRGLAETHYETPYVVLAVAEDTHRRWWDVLHNRRIRGAIDPWLERECRKLRLDPPVEAEAGV